MRWGRILLGGFLAELLVFAIVFPVRHFFGERAFLASILIASAAMPFALAIWVCRRAESGFVLQGALVGVVAMLYKVAHGLKVVGGLAGGAVGSRRKPAAG